MARREKTETRESRALRRTAEKQTERGLMDLPFLLLTLMLTTIGVVMMFSASYARAYRIEGNATYYFMRQLFFAALGIAFMFAASILRYDFYRRWWLRILGFAVFLLIAVLVVGTSGGGAKRWLDLKITTFQPSELAKLAVVISFATLISVFKEKMETLKYGVLPFASILALVSGLLILEPHLSATIIICAVGAIMMFMGGTKLRWFGVLAGVAVVGLLAYLAIKGYASERITAWRDPWADSSDTGYQIVQSLYAIGSGGLMGLGFGKSRQKYLYLPEEHNDYIFSIVCEELGFVGAVLIILLFMLLIIRGYWIALHAKDRFGALLAAGITTLFALQVFLNIGVVTNLLPSTGISLPFFSYGGTALILQLIEMGIVLNVSRNCDNNLL